MSGLGAIAFLNPWLLAALAALPILWWLLRAIPPSPRLELFAGVRLLLGLEDPERQAAKTPWWLLALRALAVAAIILGFAGPVLNPSERIAAAGDGPVMVLMDQGWASAPDWEARVATAAAAIEEAGQAGRQVVLRMAASGETTAPVAAGAARALVEGAVPDPWAPDHQAVLGALDEGTLAASGETLWMSDGLSHGEATAALAERLAAAGPLRLIRPAVP
ncbi:MAG TPA: BatA domain-containing protein, partial [Thermohalobaculum sp.]|nr:BatA domain-containing protein [Thermohalobaculum sp.]